MSRTISFPRIIRIGRFTEIFRVKGAPVHFHWSVLVIFAVILAGAVKYPVLNLIGLSSYLGVLLLHECGHLIAARRKHCEVFNIEIYPIFALTRYQTPWGAVDDYIISWGGVLAQFAIAVPLVVVVLVFGYTPFKAVNAMIAIWGPFSFGIALFNLLPFPPLDGATAWRIVPWALGRAFRGLQKRF